MPLRKIPVQVLNVQVTGTLQVVGDPTTGAVVIPTDSLGSIGISLKNGSTAPSGANVVFEGTVDGASWDAVKAFPKVIGAAGVTSAVAAGDFGVDCAEFAQIRVRLTAITAGSFAVKLNGTAAVSRMGVKNSNAADLNATVVIAAGDVQFGADGTGIAAPAGGSGLRGWLSGIYQAVVGTLSVYTANKQLTGTLTVADPTGVAAGSTVTINTDSLGAIGIKLSGNGVGTVLFQGSVDGVTWDNPKAYPLAVGAQGTQSANSAGDFEVNCAAFKQFRLCLSALTSGSFAVVLNGTHAAKHIGVKNGNPLDLQATVVGSVPDSTGNYPLSPDALPHTYTYNGPSGLIDTDTCTNGAYTWKKTYTYTGNNLTGESAWVKQ